MEVKPLVSRGKLKVPKNRRTEGMKIDPNTNRVMLAGQFITGTNFEQSDPQF